MDTANPSTSYSPAYRRAEKMINRMVNDRQLSRDGRDFIKMNLDPYMDVPLKKYVGWPDVETGYSVVRRVGQQATINPPPSLSPGTNYDAAVVLWPWINSLPMVDVSPRANNVVTWSESTGPAGVPTGGVQVYASATPMTLNTQTTYSPVQIVLSDTFTTGVGRLVSVGFELHDTTAEIYKQGSLTCAKIMQQCRTSSAWSIIDPDSLDLAGVISGTSLRSIPQSLAGLTLMPDSKTWEAKEGCYAVGHFHSGDNTPFSTDYLNPILIQDDGDGINSTPVVMPRPQNAVAGWLGSQACHLHPLHSTVVWLNGLNYNASFQLSVVYYYETFPTINESDILVLASPSTEYDPLALEILSHALSRMPPAVRVRDNFQGDWWADVVESISNVLNFIPHPLAQAASLAGKTGAGALRAFGNTEASSGYQASGGPPALPSRQTAQYLTQQKAVKKAQKKRLPAPK